MRYVDEYRNGDLAQRYASALRELVSRPWNIMEVCGGQTHAIVRFGLDELIPSEVTLLHGPGCPVCVTPVAVIDQALTLMKAHENIKCIFTTPKLLEALCERVSLKKLGITGVFCGGTEMTPQFHRFAVEELLEGVYFAPTYGNTLMGLATHKPPTKDDNWAIIYFPPSPRAMIEVVEPDEPTRVVGYGETGRVRLTTLTKEFFMPRFLERDEAERERPCEQYPWDGVRNVRPFSRFATKVVEGVY